METTESPHSDPSEKQMRDYYELRAPEYELTYQRPERQSDLARLRAALATHFDGRRVLDVACGTGYWTACFAARAREVLGIDANPGVLEVARAKSLSASRFELGDAYLLGDELGRFDAAFVGFWWSHVPRRQLAQFIANLNARLLPGARVVLLDNRFVAGNSTPIALRDAHGDAWQERRLGDGTRHLVLKNFPDYAGLMGLVGQSAWATHWWQLDYYWWFAYTLR